MGRTSKNKNIRGVVSAYEEIPNQNNVLPRKITPKEYKEAKQKLGKYFEVLDKKEQADKKLSNLKNELQRYFDGTEERKYEFDGLGTVQVTAPTVIESYDKKSIDRIKDEALRNGDFKTAADIANAQIKTNRIGSLRITKPQK